MKLSNGLGKGDRILIAGSILCLLVSTYFLMNDDLLTGMVFPSGKSIGRITARQNDTRHRANDSIAWYNTKESQEVHVGDAVFAGKESFATVELQKGESLTVGENSLVSFREIENEKLANLELGNFRIKVDGTVKIAIHGEVTTLDGKNSEVQLYLGADKKPKLKVLKGKAVVKTKKGKAITVEDTRSIADLDVLQQPQARTVPPPLPEMPINLSKSVKLTYTWRLYDLYEQRDSQLFERAKRPELVPAVAKLGWAKSEENKASVEVADNREFSAGSKFEANESFINASPVYLGKNFWRVSFDKVNWSQPETFTVEAHFLKGVKPMATTPTHEIALVTEKAAQTIAIQSPIEALGFVYEASQDEAFATGQTRTFWSPTSKLNLAFYKPGKYFYRFRIVTKQHELSDWSDNLAFYVFLPDLPPAPHLAEATKKGFISDNFSLKYNSKTPFNEIDILDKNDNVVAKFDSAKATWKPKEAGQFRAIAFAKNSYGQRSPPSKTTKIMVREKPKPIIAKAPIKPIPSAQPPQRKLAAVDSQIKTKLNLSHDSFVNEKYRDSELSMDGFLWTLQSTQQVLSNTQAPVASGLGLRGLHWWNHSGVEGVVKSEVLAANQAAHETSLKDLEARYHYRFFTPFPFHLARELQISIFGGYEMYRNTGTYFSNQYDLMTFGTSLEFPVAYRWSMGGEFVYGDGTDSSNKEEVTGHFKYYFEKTWAVGFGYRLHLFQAGSAAAAPMGVLPYREGYTEGFTTLDYHF